MKVPDGTYEGRYHNINPCEALEALEKQAPEVLREWAAITSIKGKDIIMVEKKQR